MRKLYIVIGLLTCVGLIRVQAQAVGDYRSHATGTWATAATWERWNGSSWITPAPSAPLAWTTTVTVQAAHNVTVAATLTDAATGILVNNGTVTISTGLPAKTLTITGTLKNNGTVANASTARLKFNGTANYYHMFADAGVIPAATWASTTTVNIIGYTAGNFTAPTGLNQTFGNFTWNAPNQDTPVSMGGLPTNILGSFSVIDAGNTSGTSALFYSQGGTGTTLTIGGSFTLSSIFGFTSGDAGPSTVNIGGDLTLNDPNSYLQFADDQDLTVNLTGNFNFSAGIVDFSASSANTIVNLKGNYSESSSSALTASGGSGTLNFNGTAVQTYVKGSAPTVGTVNYAIANTSILDLTTNILDGSGSLTLGPSATLKVGSVAIGGAIQAGAVGGNIQNTGARTYDPFSTITYNGLGAQKIGAGFPTNVNLEIANTSGVTNNNIGVTNVIGNLILTSGVFNIGASNTLNVQNDFIVSAGKIGGSTTSNLTFSGAGPLGTLAFSPGTEFLKNLTISRTQDVVLGSNLTVGGVITLTSGNLNFSGFTLTMNGGSIVASGQGLVSNSTSNLSFGGSTFSGSVPFSGAGNQLNNLIFSTPGGSFTWNSNVTVNNQMTLTSGTVAHSSGLTMATGSTISKGGGSITGASPSAVTSYNVLYTGTGSTSLELPSSATALNDLTITSSGTITLTSAITVNGVLKTSSGSFNTGSINFAINGNFVSNAGSTLTGSSITFGGTTTISGTTSPVFGAITISGTVTPSTSIQINGGLVVNGTLNPGTSTTTFGGTTTISGSSSAFFNNVTVALGGTLTMGLNGFPAANIAGNFINNGNFAHNNGTITFSGNTTVSGTPVSPTTTNFYKVSISGTLTGPLNASMGIAGDFANTGTFNRNGGTILINGTTNIQNITGTLNVNHVTVSNPTGVNNNGNLNLYGFLGLTATAKFDADGSGAGVLTVKSVDVNTEGGITTLATPANFTGLVTVERFINGPDSYRYISIPLTSANVGMWKTNFPVTGNFSDPSPVGVNGVISSTAPSIYRWNAATQAYVAIGSGASTAATSLSNLVGYSAYTYISSDFTISTRNNVTTGNVTPTISSSGFNLLANPYPCAIDWDNFTLTGINSTMSIRTSNNVFASYTKGGMANNAPFVTWTGEVSMGQSFWIQSSGATTIAFTESVKTTNQNQFLRESEPINYMRVVLSSDKQRDQTTFWFADGATTGVDDQFDALKMRNGYFDPGERKKNTYLNLSSYSLLTNDSTEYAIQSVSPLTCNTAFRLRVGDVAPGKYSISFEDLDQMHLGYKIILADRYTKTEKEVDPSFQYSFDVSDDKLSYGDARFTLRFIMPGSTWINSTTPPATTVTDACNPKFLPLSVETQSGVSYQFFSNTKPVSDVLAGDGTKQTVMISKENMPSGINNFTVTVSSSKGSECGDNFTFDNAISYDNQAIVPVVITKGEGEILHSSSSAGNQWLLNGSPIDGATNASYSLSRSGYYSVKVLMGTCFVKSDSVKVNFELEDVQAFPNPAEDKVYVTLSDNVNQSLRSISLYDIRGARIFDSANDNSILTSQVKVIDLSNAPSGVYILSVSSNKRYTIKIIKK